MAYNWNGVPQYFMPEDGAGGFLPPDIFTMPFMETFGNDDFLEEDIPPASTFGSSEASLLAQLYNTLAMSVGSQYQPQAMPQGQVMFPLQQVDYQALGPFTQPLAMPQGQEMSPFQQVDPQALLSQPPAMPQGEAMSPPQQVDPQAMAMVRLPPAIQQGQPLPPQPLPDVLRPNTQGVRVSKPGRNKKSAAPAQGQKAPRKVKANACKRCRKKKISCKSASDQDPCNGCKADGSECDRSGEDMRTNKSTTNKYNEAVGECENLLAQLDCLAERVRKQDVCPVALVRAIQNDATPLGEILETFFPGASIEPARQDYHLPAADAGRKLLEYRGLFETLKNAVVGHIRALGGQQPSTLVTALASRASAEIFSLGDPDGGDQQLRNQLCNSVVTGDNTILEGLIFPPLERRVGAITHAHH